MENNAVEINAQTGEITHVYVEPIEINEEIVIDYDEEVVRLIRLIYSQDDENAIQRKYLFDKGNESEFLEYYNYVENCKQQVKDLLN